MCPVLLDHYSILCGGIHGHSLPGFILKDALKFVAKQQLESVIKETPIALHNRLEGYIRPKGVDIILLRILNGIENDKDAMVPANLTKIFLNEARLLL